MANVFNNIQDAPGIIAKAAAQTLKDNLVFCNTIDQADASDYDGKNGYKAGETIYTSKPARYVPQTAFDITSTIQDSVEEKAALTLDTISTVGMEINSFEFATDVELKDTIKRFVVPAAESIAQNVENRFIQKAVDATYNSTGTGGYTTADILASRTKLQQNLARPGNRSLLLDSVAMAEAVDARKGYFNKSTEIDKQYLNGEMGEADSFTWYENELGGTHANGADVTGVAVNDASVSEGASVLTVDGAGAALTVGTVFTIADVFMVHPITKIATTVLQQFVVTTSSATVPGISPSLYAASGGLQNVDALPADDAALVFVGAATTNINQGLAYHKDAFKMVSVPLVMPTAVEVAAQETVDGITVAVIRAFDVLERRMVTRLDFLGGLSAVRPEWSSRLPAA